MTEHLVSHDPRWAKVFDDEASLIMAHMKHACVALHHIGSTAIAGVWAKPIIDILGEAAAIEAVDKATAGLEASGYQAMGEYGIPGRRYFRKTSAGGRRTHHLHFYEAGSLEVARHLAFRDYLRANPSRASEYSAVKREIGLRPTGRGLSYQEAKAPLMKRLNAEAWRWRDQLLST